MSNGRIPRASEATVSEGIRDHLLLVVMRVAAVVVGAYEGRVVDRARKIVAEVVADERVGRIAGTAAVRSVELSNRSLTGVLISTELIERIGEMNWTNGRSLDSLGRAFV